MEEYSFFKNTFTASHSLLIICVSLYFKIKYLVSFLNNYYHVCLYMYVNTHASHIQYAIRKQLFGASSHSIISYMDENDVIKLLTAEFAYTYFMILNLHFLFTIYPFFSSILFYILV